MGEALLAVRLALALVFVVAAAGKLADRAGSRQALLDFGVPAALAKPVAALLPLAELATAAALVSTAAAWPGALGALLLLALFTCAIAMSLLRGRRHDCHCFGAISSERIGPKVVARNIVFMAGAAFVVAQGRSDSGMSAFAWLDNSTSAESLSFGLALLAVAIAGVGGGLMARTAAANGGLLLRFEALESRLGSAGAAGLLAEAGLPAGSEAPGFSLPDLEGRETSLEALRSERGQVLLVFASPTCAPCDRLLPEVGRWQHGENGPAVAIVSSGSSEVNRKKAAQYSLGRVLLQRSAEVETAYRVVGTPSAVLIGADGRTSAPLSEGAPGIQALYRRAARAAKSAPAPATVAGPRAG